MLLWNIVDKIKCGQTDVLEKYFELENETNQTKDNPHSNMREGEKMN